MQIHSVPSVSSVPAAPNEPKIDEAARDFEALLIAQVLKSFRGETEEASFGGVGDSGSSTMMEFAEQHLAQVMSRQGGLGLHEVIMQGLRRRDDGSPAEAQTTG